MARSFEEVSKELGVAMNLIAEKQKVLDSVTYEADERIKQANAAKSQANAELSGAKTLASDLRSEYDELMVSILGESTGRVRQSR